MDDVLRRSPLFAALDEEASASLLKSMTEISLTRGDALFHEGDPGDQLYVVVEGKIKLGRTSGDGRENLTAVMGPGEMFGELSLFDPGPRTSTATALTATKLLALGHAELQPWLSARPEVARALLKAMARRLRRTNETLADLEKPGARNLIRTELINGFNNILGDNSVQEIYITEFGIQ